MRIELSVEVAQETLLALDSRMRELLKSSHHENAVVREIAGRQIVRTQAAMDAINAALVTLAKALNPKI